MPYLSGARGCEDASLIIRPTITQKPWPMDQGFFTYVLSKT